MMAVRAPRHTQDPNPPLQAVTSEPFLIHGTSGEHPQACAQDAQTARDVLLEAFESGLTTLC